MAVDAKIGLIEWADIEAVIGKRKRARGAEIDAMRFE